MSREGRFRLEMQQEPAGQLLCSRGGSAGRRSAFGMCKSPSAGDVEPGASGRLSESMRCFHFGMYKSPSGDFCTFQRWNTAAALLSPPTELEWGGTGFLAGSPQCPFLFSPPFCLFLIEAARGGDATSRLLCRLSDKLLLIG